MRIVIAPYAEYDSDVEWDNYRKNVQSNILSKLSNIPDCDVKFKMQDSDHGIGADWPTLILNLIEIGGISIATMIGIAALHKKV
jgi:hypothetical protein